MAFSCCGRSARLGLFLSVAAARSVAFAVGAGPIAVAPVLLAPETFVVEAFTNSTKAKSMDALEGGLPALVAERLGHVAPLRFVGGPALLGGRAAAADAKWIVGGRFERRSDWKLAVTVEIRAAAVAPGTEPVVRTHETRVGGRDAAASLVLQAAQAAFAALGDVKMPPLPAWVTAPFGRDPYAFVLYGRALAQYHGLGGRVASADRAIEIFKHALVIDPQVPEIRRYLGVVHLEAGRPGHARAMWTYALEVRPSYVAALSGLAALDRAAGLPSAREHYSRLLDLEPDDHPARRALAELLFEAGEVDRAQLELQRVLAALPGDVRTRRSLALVLASRRAGKELVADLEEVVRLDPEDLDARMDLGAAYVSVGKFAQAAATYEEILRRHPKNQVALKLAGDMAMELSDVKRAAAHYERLHRLAPDDPRPLFLLGAGFFAAGDLAAAGRRFLEAAQLPHMSGEAYANLGAIALRQGKTGEALWFLSRAAKRRPGNVVARYNHAVALHAANRSEEALTEVQAVQLLCPEDAGVRFLAGVVSLRLGLLRSADEQFAETLRLDPSNADAKHNLALLAPLVHPKNETSLSFVEVANHF